MNPVALTPATVHNEPLRYARDVVMGVAIEPTLSRRAELHLLVTKLRSMKAIMFVDVLDASGRMQLFAERSSIHPDLWNQMASLRPFDRVRVSGCTLRTRSGQAAVEPHAIQVLIKAGSAPNPPEPMSGLPLAKPFFLARLRERATTFLRERGVQEYEPDCLCMSHHTTMTSLQVVFPGWGSPVSLSVSPFRQLMDAVLLTAVPNVFSVGRCFSHAVRDGFTSAEELVICVVCIESTFQQLLTLAQECVTHVFSDLLTAPSLRHMITSSSWKEVLSGVDQEVVVVAPTVHLIPHSVSGPACPDADNDCFRLLWPPGISVAEGHAERKSVV